MHAFLVVGKDEEKVMDLVGKKVSEFGGRRFENPIATIAEVRELGKMLRLKASERAIYIVDKFDQASEAAQNAFLKILEEPQESVGFVLTATSEDGVLPTIRSRCLVIQSSGAGKVANEATNTASDFVGNSGGERMAKVAKIKGREEAVVFLTNVIIGGREMMLKGEIKPGFLEVAQEALDNINKNGNVALQLTNFVARTA